MYEVILFDLDGTLTDPGEGITNSVCYALKKFGIEAPDRRQLYRFIGPPLCESFEKYYGFSSGQAREAVAYYREYYAEKGIFENMVYDGIAQMLTELRNAKRRLALATSKPEAYAKQILSHYALDSYFEVTAGAKMDGTRTKKDEVILYALESLHVTDRSSVIMVGDREHDIWGAKKTGIDSLGVLFGYGSKEELKQAKADYIAKNVQDIAKILLNTADEGKKVDGTGTVL